MEQINNYLGKIQEYGESADGYASDLKLDLADLVLQGLDRNGISQRELAKRARVSESKISKIVHSDWNWTAKTAAKLLRALGIKATLVESTATASNYSFTDPHTDLLRATAMSGMTAAQCSVHHVDVTLTLCPSRQATQEQNYDFRRISNDSPKWIRSGEREEPAVGSGSFR